MDTILLKWRKILTHLSNFQPLTHSLFWKSVQEPIILVKFITYAFIVANPCFGTVIKYTYNIIINKIWESMVL